MERLIRPLLLLWLALLVGAWLGQWLAPSSSWSYGLVLAVVAGCPVVVVLGLGLVVLGLRQAWRRIQVLRRAAKWPRLRRERYAQGDDWLNTEY